MARDIYAEMQKATSQEEYEKLAEERLAKEAEMKAAGTWDNAWISTNAISPGSNYILGSNAPKSNPYAQIIPQSNVQLESIKRTQKQNVENEYANLGQQAYIKKMQDTNNAPAIMAMTGQTGGLAETIAMAPTLAYSNALNQLGQSKAQTLSQIDLSADQQALQMAIDYADKAIAQANLDRNFNYGVSRDRLNDSRYADETIYNRNATAEQTAYQKAFDAAKLGDFTGLRNLGLDTSGAEKDYANRNNPYYGKAVSGGSSKPPAAAKPVLTEAAVRQAIKDNRITPNVQSAYEYYYGEPYSGQSESNTESNPQISGIAKLANNLWNNTGGDRYQLLRFLSTYQGREGITDDDLKIIAGQFGVSLE